MKSIPYASVVGNLMYFKTYTRPDIRFAVGCLVDIKVILELSIGRLQRKFYGTYKEQKTTCSRIGDIISWK